MNSAVSSSAAVVNAPVEAIVTKPRIASIDIVRGVVMLLMAIDHVRVYSGLPAGGPTPGIFFTRWVTHFVAPAFCFLAGTGAWFHGKKLGSKAALAKFLLTRGAWLILLELTVLRVAWTFNFDFQHYMLAGVIWMLGWCMILLAGLIWLPLPVIAGVGVAIIGAHNILDYYTAQIFSALHDSSAAWIVQVLYFGGVVNVGKTGIPLAVLYSIIPWIGVMAAGYAFGKLMEQPVEKRRRINLVLGCACIVLFLMLRAVDGYGDPRHWNPKPPAQSATAQSTQQSAHTPPRPSAPPAYIRFLNTTKYPASLLFLLMTLGPMFLGVAFSENLRGKIGQAVAVFGRVPMFYYVLHIPLIHVLAILVTLVRAPGAMGWLFTNHPMLPPPPPSGYTWTLPLLYAIWILAIAILYFPCRWFAELKARRKNSRWLSYL